MKTGIIATSKNIMTGGEFLFPLIFFYVIYLLIHLYIPPTYF